MTLPVVIRPVTGANWRTALALAVRPDQQHFVAGYTPPAVIALAKAYIRPGGQIFAPLALYVGDEMVGFCAIAHRPDSTDYWLNHFFIDQQHQGRGYGRAGLLAVVAWLRSYQPDSTDLYLTVHPDNTVAQELYQRFGFHATGRIVDQELLYQLPLTSRDGPSTG